MLINNKYNLTYCSNIFKDKNLNNLKKNIEKFLKKIKQINMDPIGISLCLSNNLSKTLIKNKIIKNLNLWLKEHNIYVSSINGFVYKDFHEKNIKENIYLPDWTSLNRVKFYKKIIFISEKLHSINDDFSISVMPITYKKWIKNYNLPYVFYKSSVNFSYLLKILIKLNKNIHLDIEPEPYCVIETYNDFLNFFNSWLKPVIKRKFKNKFNNNKINSLIYNHIRLCYDVCHFSVNFEDHVNILNSFLKSKILIGKIQISSALEMNMNYHKNLKNFKDNCGFLYTSNFLHQCVIKKNDKFEKYCDIKYFPYKDYFNNTSLRIHCHVPIFLDKMKKFTTTNNDIKLVVNFLKKNFLTKHIEIETYTQKNLFKNSDTINFMLKEYKWLLNLLKE
jgi:hypothetical protein